MHHQSRIIAALLLLLSGALSSTAQKTVVSKKNPVTTEYIYTDTGRLQLNDLIARGDSCMLQYDTYAALAYYQQAYSESQSLETRQKLANCLYQRCDYRQCATLLIGLPTESMSHDALRQLFFCYGYLKDDQHLIHYGQELLRRFPMDAEVLARLCTVLCDNDKTQEAVLRAQDYYRRDSTNILINRTLANCFYLNKEYQACIHQYQKIMAVGDTTFLGLYSIGMSYDYIGDKQQAYDYLLMAFKKNEKSPGCCYRLGIVCVDLKRFEDAHRYLTLAEYLLKPDRTIMKVICDHQAKAYYRQENYIRAAERWKKAREYDGTSLAFLFNIGSCYAALHEAAKADSTIDGRPTDVQKLQELALSYYGLFIEMATDNGIELDEETKQMIKEAKAYMKQN